MQSVRQKHDCDWKETILVCVKEINYGFSRNYCQEVIFLVFE